MVSHAASKTATLCGCYHRNSYHDTIARHVCERRALLFVCTSCCVEAIYENHQLLSEHLSVELINLLFKAFVMKWSKLLSKIALEADEAASLPQNESLRTYTETNSLSFSLRGGTELWILIQVE